VLPVPVTTPPMGPKGRMPPVTAVPVPVPVATPPLKALEEEKPEAEAPPKPTLPVPPALAFAADRYSRLEMLHSQYNLIQHLQPRKGN